jgi:hypothetical protein
VTGTGRIEHRFVPRCGAVRAEISNVNELRLGLRSLTRAPAYYALCTITLALGIGIATLMFSVTESVLWRPLPLPHPEELVMVFDQQIKNPMNNTGSAAADFLEWGARAQSFASLRSTEIRDLSPARHPGDR